MQKSRTFDAVLMEIDALGVARSWDHGSNLKPEKSGGATTPLQVKIVDFGGFTQSNDSNFMISFKYS